MQNADIKANLSARAEELVVLWRQNDFDTFFKSLKSYRAGEQMVLIIQLNERLGLADKDILTDWLLQNYC